MTDCKMVGLLPEDGYGKFEMPRRVYDTNYLSPAIRTMQGGNLEPKIAEPIIYDDYNSRIKTVTAECNGLCRIEPQFRIRKLTPKECWRLMGFSDEDFEKAHWYTEEEVEKMHLRKRKNGKDIPFDQKIERVSSSQLYKQAGNSIVVNVLMEIFKEMI